MSVLTRAQRQKKLRKSAGAWAEGTVWAEWRWTIFLPNLMATCVSWSCCFIIYRLVCKVCKYYHWPRRFLGIKVSCSGQTTSPAFLAGSSQLGGRITGGSVCLFSDTCRWLTMISHPCAPTYNHLQEKNQIQVSRGSCFPLSRSTYQVFFTSRFLQIKAPLSWIDTSMKTTWRKSSSWKLWKGCWKPTRDSGLKSRAGMIGEYFSLTFKPLLMRAGSSSIWMLIGISYFFCANDTIIMSTCQRCDTCIYIERLVSILWCILAARIQHDQIIISHSVF